MKTSSFSIQIPKPCHEDWNKMTPNAQGAFCSSCKKSVVDFTTMKIAQIESYFHSHKNEHVCGRFTSKQVNSNNTLSERSVLTAQLITFAAALLFVFGSALFTINSPTPTTNQTSADSLIFEPTMGITVPELEQDTILNYESTITGEPRVIETHTILSPDTLEADTINLSPVVITDYYAPLIDATSTTGSVVITGLTNYCNLNNLEAENNKSVIANKIEADTKNYQEVGFKTFPNPTTGPFTIAFSLTKATSVSINVFNLEGKLIKQLADTGNMYAGEYQINADLENEPNGIYFIQITIGEKITSERIILNK